MEKIFQKNGSGSTTLNNTSEDVLLRHLNSFQDNDIETLMSDYTEESILVTQDQVYSGPERIKIFFTGLIAHFPKGISQFQLDKMITESNLVYIIWHAKTPSLEVLFGSDTFIIKDNKIHQQTVAWQLKQIN